MITKQPPLPCKAHMQVHKQPVKRSRQTASFCFARLENVLSTCGNCTQDFDDDGETAAGGRLLHLLQVGNCKNVLVVVSRWFGGVLLGPARFTHINNAARVLLEQCGYLGDNDTGTVSKKGKRR